MPSYPQNVYELGNMPLFFFFFFFRYFTLGTTFGSLKKFGGTSSTKSMKLGVKRNHVLKIYIDFNIYKKHI
jgi:hypothetical protein